VARLHLETEGDAALFGFGSAQDFADSSRVIAFASAGGLAARGNSQIFRQNM